jgi:serine/threonine protein kinase
LHARLERGPLPIADTIALGIAVAGALHAAHRVGLVHRDIKPANLLLCGGDPRTVKVLDFGIVRWHGRVITASSAAFGTPGYMAPEQARSAGSVDARADVFSLGCVLFEAASGVPVFAGEDIIAVLTKVMMERRRRCPSAASVPASCRPDPASSSSRRPPVLASLPSGTTLTSSARSSTCDVRVSTSQTTS